ncbi:putative hemoglobin and hemoglobin-haptoglobin-binding protein 3 [Trichinella pseudospiralis]|uniref:Putative hemoglobin and hemoglobin-haptoglobin-binding protein 3 n=1 Tax=Trichinella pseudospiralis TaxID=6337 RepID=A0A0V1JFE3_TRIPS|nr:putative hemoglobin and hemoglobin-haptoglobin-binding protein 3 [Trichinella pseudospiralis]KRZ33679.1 putative hemoglobin and hemoglobin-haptoglobin-binding protein 3 [Trichinella pseudospiralis]
MPSVSHLVLCTYTGLINVETISGPTSEQIDQKAKIKHYSCMQTHITACAEMMQKGIVDRRGSSPSSSRVQCMTKSDKVSVSNRQNRWTIDQQQSRLVTGHESTANAQNFSRHFHKHHRKAQLTYQPTNQPTNQPTDQPINQPSCNQSTNQPEHFHLFFLSLCLSSASLPLSFILSLLLIYSFTTRSLSLTLFASLTLIFPSSVQLCLLLASVTSYFNTHHTHTHTTYRNEEDEIGGINNCPIYILQHYNSEKRWPVEQATKKAATKHNS